MMNIIKPIFFSMPTIPNSSSSDTLHTTKTERQKAEILKRCFINMLKCLRVCKKTPKNTNGV